MSNFISQQAEALTLLGLALIVTMPENLPRQCGRFPPGYMAGCSTA